MSEAEFVCECEEDYRSACQGLGFYREVEGKRYCVLHCPVQDKEQEFDDVLRRKLSSFEYDFRGVYFPSDVSFANEHFVAAASFKSAIFSAPVSFWSAIFNTSADFREVIFSANALFTGGTFSAAAYFSKATFNAITDFSQADFSATADFSKATFNADVSFRTATFSAAAYFSVATFSGTTDFIGATLSADAHFGGATFSADAYFWAATFSADAQFGSAIFNADADFSETTFSATANFSKATFSAVSSFRAAKIRDRLQLFGSKAHPVFAKSASFDFFLAQVNEPEQIVFHTVRLRPHWFVNVDARKFEFTNVEWVGVDFMHLEVDALRARNIEHPHRLLSIACRRLATNAEDNNRYDEAARFRYASMDVRRLEQWRGWNCLQLDWWYWLVSGYGERSKRAAIVLLLLLLGFAGLYRKVGFEVPKPTEAAIAHATSPPAEARKDLPLPSYREAITYTMNVALFQKPEPKAYTFWAKTWVVLEMVLVPLQAALLALAIRRRFMK